MRHGGSASARPLTRTGAVAAALGTVAAGTLASACGVAAYFSPTGHGPVPRARAAAVGLAGSRAQADAMARRMLARFRPPPGGTAWHGPLPAAARRPGASIGTATLADLDIVVGLRLPAAAAYRFLVTHPQPGLRRMPHASGQLGGYYLARYHQRRVPRGIAEAYLIVTVTSGQGGGSVLRADAEVAWYPLRAVRGYIDPHRFRVVTVTRLPAPGSPRQRATVTSRAVIAAMAGLVNHMPVGVAWPRRCHPRSPSAYRLTFAVTAAAKPSVLVRIRPCGGDTVTVAGRSQQGLADLRSRLRDVVNGVLAGRRTRAGAAGNGG